MKNQIFLLLLTLLSATAFAQTEVPFNGLVMDSNGLPVKNVKIYVQDPSRYTRSDKKGRFGLTDVKDTDTLHLSWKKKSYDVPVDGKKSVKIYMADEKQLRAEEDKGLVDMGYDFVSRREFTGSSNGISGDVLRRTGYTDLLSALQGRIPGLNINGGQVSMRGINSFYADQTPLFVLDGVIVESLSNVSVYDVEHVEVMKEASIYGSRGANGAILVRTKRGAQTKE